MTETIVVSKEHDGFFRQSCKENKIDFELTGEGIDGDTYTITFDFPGELYFLGRHFQLLIAKKFFDKLL